MTAPAGARPLAAACRAALVKAMRERLRLLREYHTTLTNLVAGVAVNEACGHAGEHLDCVLCDAVRLLVRGEEEIQRMDLETR